eukprot:CAMPEP_0202509484 /NCGR_PEP_ID=MMETSP1361-20130828/52797_1 /ASSEMBLY_ACC=CAM_ASM_000849 /TAXON_ID=210615 /ORGANISM="Staurosira complex sp., Strain CCMP2646" /LENGTH=107 /DNA_ID=CAMNT_0049143707 /DNA_START=1611 /DNA_END=1931 /DNA_ORIENTATION=+
MTQVICIAITVGDTASNLIPWNKQFHVVNGRAVDQIESSQDKTRLFSLSLMIYYSHMILPTRQGRVPLDWVDEVLVSPRQTPTFLPLARGGRTLLAVNVLLQPLLFL